MAPLGGLLWRSRRVYQIWGANTDVGKTVISTILCLATRGKFRKEHTAYLKPVSTGPIEDADDQCMSCYSRSLPVRPAHYLQMFPLPRYLALPAADHPF